MSFRQLTIVCRFFAHIARPDQMRVNRSDTAGRAQESALQRFCAAVRRTFCFLPTNGPRLFFYLLKSHAGQRINYLRRGRTQRSFYCGETFVNEDKESK